MRISWGAALGGVTAIVLLALAGATQAQDEAVAPARGGPRLNAYFASGFGDAAWQQAALDKVAKGWKAAGAPAPGKKAVLIATIARDGSLTGLRDHLKSENAAWDKAAIEALKAAAPFPALPKSWPHPDLEVHWHFEMSR